jgi:hypothetical protein
MMKTVKFISEETDYPPLKGLSTRILRHLFMGLTNGFGLYPAPGVLPGEKWAGCRDVQ